MKKISPEIKKIFINYYNKVKRISRKSTVYVVFAPRTIVRGAKNLLFIFGASNAFILI